MVLPACNHTVLDSSHMIHRSVCLWVNKAGYPTDTRSNWYATVPDVAALVLPIHISERHVGFLFSAPNL